MEIGQLFLQAAAVRVGRGLDSVEPCLTKVGLESKLKVLSPLEYAV
jgi:hypothetical protein